ncbi:MAG: uroporphyrinogen decarboxylase family protein [Planctomycetota bacterium]
MNSRERLMSTLRGESVDRPAVNLYEIGGLVMDPDDADRFNVYSDPSWRPLLELAENQTDIIRLRSPVRKESYRAWGESEGEKGARDEFFKVESRQENDCLTTRTTLTVGGRTMTSTEMRKADVDTVWTTEHLLKSKEDIEAYLELPEEVFSETVDIEPLVEEEKKLGERGIVMVDTEEPLCSAATLFSMEDYTVFALTEQKLFHQLLEKLSGHILERTAKTSAAFPGRLWRIYGAEFATEPYLPPRLFEEYVVRYCGPMVKMIHEHGGFARIHCHGRIRNVLDHIVGMGADAIDPVESFSQGDIDLKEVRKKYGKQLVLFGNIEIADIEILPNKEFGALVDRTLGEMSSGEGRGFVLMPTASPCGRKVSSQTLRNYKTLVQKAHDF